MSAVTVEICIDGADGLVAAVAGGAGRIELCSALSLGGLTPSPGLMTLAARAPVPVYAMIRPRAGDFVFSPAEIDQMRREIDAVREAGLAGVVLGASEPGGALDENLLARLALHAEGLGRTLHRAFDLVPDRAAALETAVALGFERILTSGGAAKAGDALPAIAALVKQAAARISVMPGSGVRPDNAASIIAATGAREIHASCRAADVAFAAEAIALGFTAEARRVETSEAMVAALVEALQIEQNRT
ncbi:copper homeostasis protein CutC [Kaistia geumhonensis]|uniref:PF03932 family protein CutC n=1 Tax=Kaistia geumhonensis TaxID=410839 RepID=A0ABU0MBS6_9HYPH|nr:copper homeostasis protein CutC [Kaistia geumhonensis]MCX5481358.1 copper homeostasis protein CutC [Kaistia geumhonensis]MDQ0518420.1 copper homeostasis protein [Kaistia geumhonensis]